MKHLFRIKRKAVIKNSTTRLPDHLWLGYVKVLVWLYDIPSAHRTYFFELLNRIQSLRRNSGDTWTVGYLKESHRLSSHWLSGNPDVCSGSIRVSVRGLPLIIPGRLRNAVYSRNNINITRALLTLLSTFRVMSATPKLKLGTITDPFNGVNETLPSLEVSRALKNILQGNKFIFKKEDIKDPYSVNRLMDITKAGPNGGVSLRNVIIDAYALMKHPKVYTSLLELSNVMSPYLGLLLRNQTTIIRAIIDYDPIKWERIKPFMAPVYQSIKDRSLKLMPDLSCIGKLSTKEEAAGKVRVFAMVDIWTQSILNPLHKKIFSIIRELPTDGTFDQLKPLDRLHELSTQDRFSFDLSAATDRLPLTLQKDILTLLVSPSFAEAWGTALVGRPYKLKFGTTEDELMYSVGQPMGALSSWGMLALTHHTIVQVAASRAGYKDLFLDYALLGDDICIANKAVADNYLLIMRDLGVEINLSKSLISSTGVVEFAKRWRVGQTDVSPASPALITRLLSNMNYLPVLILDLVNRGVKTIQNSEKLLSLPDSLQKIKKSITFSLIPYYDPEFAKCLLPLKGKDKSFSQKELFALYVHTDRIFNKLGLLEFHKAKDGDQENSKLSQSYLYNILDNSKLPLPAITSQIDNILIAQMKTITNVPTRNWLNNRDINLLTFECWHSYLIDTLSELSSISKVVPDYTITKDNEKPDNLEMRRNLLFMQELIKDLKKWNPGIFEIIPESILKEEEV
uniref:RNA dependent RNA polymerase n=1 Tax=Botrytis cinerea mitovirus 1 TaxID=444193 RepID=A0A0S4GA35_9VIRU|nr:RNA dependent RNA polymerase [Botrytis cinerea mitovirus 1]